MKIRTVFRFVKSVIILLLIAFIVFVLFSAITKYRPQDVKLLESNDKPTILSDTATVELLTWNTGYSSLGDDAGGFNIFGRISRTAVERILQNYYQINEYLKTNRHKDFILLQRVDKNSRRSFNINALDSLKQLFSASSIIYGNNFNVRLVPFPPFGHVNSGIVTISNSEPFIAERHSYPGNYPALKSLFYKQRCYTLSRYQVENGRELVIINTHNSKPDYENLLEKQTNHIKKILNEEYNKGNYVIAGGTWNISPPGFEPDFFFNRFETVNVYFPGDNLEDWQWAYDKNVPTKRRLDKPYNPAETLTTLVDYFIVSPNIKVIDVEGVHLDFKYSDHNPVKIKARLLGDKTIKPVEYIER